MNFLSVRSMVHLMGLMSFTGCISLFAAEATQSEFHWPKHYKAAVVLGYDDALDSQLDHAIPSLNKYHLKGTFFVKLASPVIANRLGEWRKAAKQGHELANHTLFHQCGKSIPGRDWVLPEDDLDKISVAQMVEQVTMSNTMLYAIDGKKERTMTTPCFDQKAAGGLNYVEVIKPLFVGIRDNGGGALTPDMNSLDPAYVTTTAPSGVTGKQLIAIVEEAASKGTMANFTFHGVGGGLHYCVCRSSRRIIKIFSGTQRYLLDGYLFECDEICESAKEDLIIFPLSLTLSHKGRGNRISREPNSPLP